MLSVSTKIWTRVAVSNSYDNNHYTTDNLLVLNLMGKEISKEPPILTFQSFL